MARSRNIKPGFFANDLLAEVQPLGRLLFAGIWTLADREGRLEDRPKKIKAQIFPYDECDVDALLGELARREFIQRYEADGLRVIQVATWHKHQNPHIKEPASTLPAPDKHSVRPVLLSGDTAASTSREPLHGGATSCENPTELGVVPEEASADSIPASVITGTQPNPASAPAGQSAGSGPADSGFLIPDPPFPNPDSPPSPTPEPRPANSKTRRALPVVDSDKQRKPSTSDSVMPSLGDIAKKVSLQLSPPEVAGFIMAHFPMQQVDRHQRAVPGDSGLTLDQVHCITRHGCTLQNARRAFEHFQQEENPKKTGAWAFHCLKEELSQDARIELREETRSTQRDFKEQASRRLKEEPSSNPTGGSHPVSAA